MRVSDIEFLGVSVTPRTNWCFLLVRTEDGRTGCGECSLANQEPLLAAEAARATRWPPMPQPWLDPRLA